MAKIQRKVIEGNKKECTRCKEILLLDKFYFTHRYSSMCKVCVRQRAIDNAKNCGVCGVLTTNYFTQEDGSKKCYKCSRKEKSKFKLDKKRELVNNRYIDRYSPVVKFVDRMIERDFTTYSKIHTIWAVNDIINNWNLICRNSVMYDDLPMATQIKNMLSDLVEWRQNDYKEPE